MKFADIHGHEDIKARLRHLVDSGEVPHALMLEGPAGSAKFMLARAYIQYLHCDNRSAGDSCGRCRACIQHESFNHIDTFFSFPIVKKGQSAVTSDDYRKEFIEFISDHPYMHFEHWLKMLDNVNAQPQIYVEEAAELQRRLNYSARQSKYKVVMLWLPERLKEEAANKLLKLVEEPASDTVFVMVSNNSRGVLPTIYSRTQRIAVRPYPDNIIADILHDTSGLAPHEAQSIAVLAQGNVNTALAIAGDDKERAVYLDMFKQLMRDAYSRKIHSLRTLSQEIAALGRESNMRFYDYCAHMLRENFIMHVDRPELSLMSNAEAEFSRRFSPFINERNVLELFNELNNARADIAANGNAKIINFDLAIKIIMLLKQ